MKQEFLLQAIGQIDDDLIVDAEQSVKRTVPLRRQIGPWAAVLLVCVGVGSAFALWRTGSGASMAAPESAAVQPVAPMAPMESQIPEKPVPSVPGALADAAASVGTVNPSESMKPVPPVEPGAAGGPAASADPTGTSDAAGSAAMITTREGAYILQPVQAESLPADCRALGTLSLAATGGTEYPVTPDARYVGCPVWVSADGAVLYLQLADGRLLCAIPAE
jgi:hypothetical protein